MQLKIRHETLYRYRRPVELQAHRLILVPRSSHELQILDASLRCTPDADLTWAQDVFGNLIATAGFGGSTDRLSIVAEMTVAQTAPAWPVFPVEPAAHSYPFEYSGDERTDLGALLAPPGGEEHGPLASYARGFVMEPHTDTLSLLKDVNAGILARVAYRERDEEGTQSPLETLRLASGSCRDIAALFIAMVRCLGFGARAVSGHLFDPDAASADDGSTHAWAEVYLPGAGWIAFDPTHRRVGAANLVPVAIARCNAQIMPVSGGYVGAADDFASMQVRVAVTRLG